MNSDVITYAKLYIDGNNALQTAQLLETKYRNSIDYEVRNFYTSLITRTFDYFNARKLKSGQVILADKERGRLYIKDDNTTLFSFHVTLRPNLCFRGGFNIINASIAETSDVANFAMSFVEKLMPHLE